MNTTLTKCVLLFTALPLGVAAAQAQLLTKVTVLQNGASQSFTMYDSGKMFFSGNTSLVIDTIGNGNTVVADLKKVDKILFSTFVPSSSGNVSVLNDASAMAVIPAVATEQISVVGVSGSFTYQIVDFSGRILLQGIAVADEAIGISSLPKGVFLIRINGSILKFSKL